MKKRALLLGTILLILIPGVVARADPDPGSLDTGFNPGVGANNEVYAIALQSDGKVLIGGTFTTVDNQGRNRIARLNADGTLDTSFNPLSGADYHVRAIALQTDNKVLIGGAFSKVDGQDRSCIARLNPDGTLDGSFDPGTGADSTVFAVAVQPDGKVLIGGHFTTVNGTIRNRVARLNTDGSLDETFDVQKGPNSIVEDFALLPDGKIIIVGIFTSVNDTPRNRIARLNVDGSVDTLFNPPSGADGPVRVVALQPDGKVLIGGIFDIVNGVGRRSVARLYADGSLDYSFTPTLPSGNVDVFDLAVQPDGKIVIGGEFDLSGIINLARLKTNGGLDWSFSQVTSVVELVSAIVIQPDNKILVGWSSEVYNAPNPPHIRRLHSDGSIDNYFYTSLNGSVFALEIQPDSKVLIGGTFTDLIEDKYTCIGRLLPNGTIDASFGVGSGANFPVLDMAFQDEKVVIVGWFNQVNGVPRNHIARLFTNGSLDPGFTTGTDGWIHAVAVQSDGKILIGGEFENVSFSGISQARRNIARLNADGTLDTGFDPGYGPNDLVTSIAIQDDGMILIGGAFSVVGARPESGIARLKSTGEVDRDFNAYLSPSNDVEVSAIALQPDGKILVGGLFEYVGAVEQANLARLNPDSTLDNTFTPQMPAEGHIFAIATQTDGKVLIGGDFNEVNGGESNYYARLNSDGSTDGSFDSSTGANDMVWDIAVQESDGSVLLGGSFTLVNSESRKYVARLNGANAAVITSQTPPSTTTYGAAYSHTFNASGYPFDPIFMITDGSLPPGLSLNSGVLTGTPTASGTYSFKITASNYVAPSDIQDVTILVEKADTTAAITAHTPNPSTVGQPVTVSYTATSTNGTPTGNVTVSDGTDNCSGTVAAGSCSLTFTSAGTKTLTATYLGDGNFSSSVSVSVSHSVQNPIPTITSLAPSAARVGGPSFTLTVNGTNYIEGISTVRWNGSDRGTTFVSKNRLTAQISAADIASAGAATVTVFNSTPGGGESNSNTFTISPDIPVTGNITIYIPMVLDR